MREFTALVNPVSGGGEAAARLRPVLDALRALGSEVVLERTRSAAHAGELATEAARNGRVVLAVGGDGLVRDAAGAVVRAGGTLGIVPAGRGNDFARTLGLPGEPDRLATLLHEGAVRELDVLDANGVIVPGNVYAGIDSQASVLINANRWVPAALLYRIAPVLAFLRWKPAEYTLEIDGEPLRVRANTVVLANSGAYGHGLRIVPPAVLDDGRADVLVVGEGPRSAIVRFMREAKTGSHVRRPEVSLRTAREISMRVDRPVPLCADGDVIGELPVTVRLRSGALRVITG